MHRSKAPIMLIILDGLGYRHQTEYNAYAHARAPHLKEYMQRYANTLLNASGTAVGLPEHYIGNSEVGHATIGTGMIIPQPVTLINRAIDDNSFFSNSQLHNTLERTKETTSTIHIMGLLSDAGIHGHEKHIHAYIAAAHQYGIANIIVHPFLDGRDVAPKSASTYLERLQQVIESYSNAHIGTIHGRFYAMDRDHNWKRTRQSFAALTQKQKRSFKDWRSLLSYYYERSISDEFIPPTQLQNNRLVQDNDTILFGNFRPDRSRQLTRVFTDKTFITFRGTNIPSVYFVTPVSYNSFADIETEYLFQVPKPTTSLKRVLNKHKRTMFTIAETEKYAHVTYFFDGGHEELFSHETRVLIPSLKKKNYDQHPEMSAQQITKAVLASLQNNPVNFYLINYANADMVGHSGNFGATVQAIECLDHQIYLLHEQVVKNMNGTIYLTADHGNAEDMYDQVTGQVRTAHTTNPVPFIYMNSEPAQTTLPLTQLSDIAPFILQQMNLAIPPTMQTDYRNE